MATDATINQLEGLTERPAGLSVQGALARDLRNVPLARLTVADLRVLLLEGEGLAHVVPLALDIVTDDPDASGCKPFFVDIDSRGNNYFETLEADTLSRIQSVYKELGIPGDFDFTDVNSSAGRDREP